MIFEQSSKIPGMDTQTAAELLMRRGSENIRVTHYQRRSTNQSFSIERLYRDIRREMPSDIKVESSVSHFFSRGMLRRLFDILRAPRYQGEVNHVTGDVHFITYLLDRKRTILTIHDCEMLERSSGIKHWLLWFFWFWLAEKRCRIIVAISEETKKQILGYLQCDSSKIIVIHDPVSKEFQPCPKPFNEVKPRLLQIGTKANKNIDRLALALAGLDITLIIVGQLSPHQEVSLNKCGVCYENKIGLSNSELVKQYKDCDLLVFASTSEGFGLPIVEAQAVGRPVVTSCISSMPEVAGEAACLVDPFDAASIRAGIVKVIEDSTYRQTLIQLGFQNVRRFQVTQVAEKYAKLYRALALSNASC